MLCNFVKYHIKAITTLQIQKNKNKKNKGQKH